MFQFPPSPAPDQTFTPVAGVTYRWSGTAWHLIAGPGAFLTPADADTRYVNVDEAQNTTNRIINGKMAIDQRNAGAEKLMAVVQYTLDRWQVWPSLANTLNAGQKPLTPGAYYLMAKTNIVQAENSFIRQVIEGVNIVDLAYGTATASPLILVFEVRATIAGTGTVALRGATTMQYYTVTFPVTTSFTTVTVNVPGATTGTWDVGNGAGFYIDWLMTPGPASFAPAASTAWAVGSFISVTGATNFMATVGNEYHLRNVRLYKGSVDFGPDRRLYAEELALCQRYYCKSYNQATVPGTAAAQDGSSAGVVGTAGNALVTVRFPQTMRTTPIIVLYSPITGATGVWRRGTAGVDGSVATFVNGDATLVVAGGGTAGETLHGQFTASAEL